jgi:hypothetical protein
MVRHVVMFRWIEGVTDDQKAAVRHALAQLPDSVPEIIDYWFGDDLGLTVGNFDFAVVGDFQDRDAYFRYAQHPAHVAAITEYVRPIVRERVAVQHQWVAP